VPIVYLALGSNLGNRRSLIQQAVDELQANGIPVKKISSIIETKPVGGPQQENFLNAVLQAETSLDPHQLLSLTQNIEKKMGRTRDVLNGPRTIDIDILLYNNQSISTLTLIIPHPRMLERDFVMNPLKEIAPDIAENLKCKS